MLEFGQRLSLSTTDSFLALGGAWGVWLAGGRLAPHPGDSGGAGREEIVLSCKGSKSQLSHREKSVSWNAWPVGGGWRG